MKKIISIFLITALLSLLAVSNPTVEEYSKWYARQYCSEEGGALDQIMEGLTQYLAQGADRQNYLICSVYTYNGHTTLGIALQFIPVDALADKIVDIRRDYAVWLEGKKP